MLIEILYNKIMLCILKVAVMVKVVYLYLYLLTTWVEIQIILVDIFNKNGETYTNHLLGSSDAKLLPLK